MSYTYIVLLIIGLDTLRMISIKDYCASIGRFYNRFSHFTSAQSVFSIRREGIFSVFICLFFSSLYLPVLLHAFFAIFVSVTFDVVCLKSVRLKHIDRFSHFLELNYRGLNFNVLKLTQLLIDGDEESIHGLQKMLVNLHVDVQRK